jgi:thiosulfate dehydrogenase
MKRTIIVVAVLLFIVIFACTKQENNTSEKLTVYNIDSLAKRYDTSKLKDGDEKQAILYGRELFFNTHKYLGPNGTVAKVATNEMACKNCHLNGGIKPNGMPLFTVVARYPQFRAREGKILSIQDRVNNCLTNPLLGHSIPLDSREMNAFVMYLKWLWDCNNNSLKLEGDIPNKIEWIDRAANWQKGKQDYQKYCVRCHMANGEGVLNPEGGYVYPPVFGMKSFALGSSMHRIGKMAAFLYYNMPNDKDITKVQLTEEEAYDIAAYINYEKINPRPTYNKDEVFYPEPAKKAVDFPLGPYADPFSEEQHRFGPFKEIEKWWADKKKGK